MTKSDFESEHEELRGELDDPLREGAAPALAPDAAAPAVTSERQLHENLEVATVLERIGQLLTAQQASPFRARAYREAAVQVRRLRQPLRSTLEARGVAGIDALPAIGPSIAAVIHEYLLTGHVRLLSRLEGRLAPEDVFITLPGIGESLAQRLHQQLGAETLEELELAAHDGRLQRIPGFGPRRTRALQGLLAARLSRSLRRHVREQGPSASASPALEELPDVATLLALDASYRERSAHGELHRIAPRRFNPLGQAWLPILHAERGGWHFTALFSNSARAHELHRTRDWVVIYYARDGREGQCTVVTEWRGMLAGRRVVRGRERECSAHYELAAGRAHSPASGGEGPRAPALASAPGPGRSPNAEPSSSSGGAAARNSYTPAR